VSLLTDLNGVRTLTITGRNFAVDPEDTIIPNEYPESDTCVSRTCWGGDGSFFAQQSKVNTSLLNTTYNTTDPNFLLRPSNGFDRFSYNTNPWSYSSIFEQFTAPLTSTTTSNTVSMYQYENKTFPLTGGTPGSYGVKVTETATTCPNITNYTFDSNSATTSLNNYVRYNYSYNVSYIDNLDNSQYQITATPISSNGQPNITTPPILVGSGTTNPMNFDVIDPNYFI
jgi:hypothetical protein